MQVDDIPLMSMLKDRMSWLSRRQEILAQNVASADVPGYTPRDLKEQDFEQTLRSSITRSGASTSLAITDPRHIPASSSTSGGYEERENRDVAAASNGNSVSLEQQMIKVADTQAQYQMASNVYAKAITMMKTAIGKGGG